MGKLNAYSERVQDYRRTEAGAMTGQQHMSAAFRESAFPRVMRLATHPADSRLKGCE